MGADLQWTPISLAGDIVAISAWGGNALTWIGERFAGKPTRSSC